MIKIDLKRLASLEQEWEAIENSYRISKYLAPINREEECQKTLDGYARGETYNPQFSYLEPPEYPVPHIRDFRARLRPQHSPIEAIYDTIATYALLSIQAVQTHEPGVITAGSTLQNGLPDTQLLQEAYRILQEEYPQDMPDSPDLNPTLCAEDVASEMQGVIDSAGIQEWQALAFEPMSASMSVNRLDKWLKIRKGDTYSRVDLRRLIVHEIGVHIVRYENGRRQPIRLFANGFPGYISTEEGLAVYSEAKAGLLETETLRKYAGRVIAANQSLSKPFSEVFCTLTQYVAPETAFNIATRAKRGFRDTSRPGAHVKDLVYLQGYLAITTHLEKQPDDYALLFSGKFGLQQLDLVRELFEQEVLLPPRWLPSQLTSSEEQGAEHELSST